MTSTQHHTKSIIATNIASNTDPPKKQSWSAIAAIGTTSEGKTSMPIVVVATHDTSTSSSTTKTISTAKTVTTKSNRESSSSTSSSIASGRSVTTTTTTATATATATTTSDNKQPAVVVVKKNPWKILQHNIDPNLNTHANGSKTNDTENAPTPAESKDMKAPIRPPPPLSSITATTTSTSNENSRNKKESSNTGSKGKGNSQGNGQKSSTSVSKQHNHNNNSGSSNSNNNKNNKPKMGGHQGSERIAKIVIDGNDKEQVQSLETGQASVNITTSQSVSNASASPSIESQNAKHRNNNNTKKDLNGNNHNHNKSLSPSGNIIKNNKEKNSQHNPNSNHNNIKTNNNNNNNNNKKQPNNNEKRNKNNSQTKRKKKKNQDGHNGLYTQPLTQHQITKLKPKAVEQVEYFFSTTELAKNVFLRKYMDTSGFVPFAFIYNFPSVSSYQIPYLDLLHAIDEVSQKIDVDLVNECVRIKCPIDEDGNEQEDVYKKWLFPNSDGTFGCPRWIKESTPSIENQKQESQDNMSNTTVSTTKEDSQNPAIETKQLDTIQGGVRMPDLAMTDSDTDNTDGDSQ